MKCPNCAVELQMSERKGVEIDYCPSCRGIWLDRGELDKLLEHANREQVSRERYTHDDDDDDDDHDDDDNYNRGDKRADKRGTPPSKSEEQYPKKRESFWSDLFDFGG